jgi:transcriptional regulator with XRE-family HTH domain
LEERIGKEANYITRIETGRIESPPLDVISSIAEGLGVLMSDLFSFEGLDDSANELRAKILGLIDTNDPAVLRKYYRLLLVAQEK